LLADSLNLGEQVNEMLETSWMLAGRTARTRRVVGRIGLGLLALTVVVSRAGIVVGDETRPNFIILLADDLGYGELGCQGNTEIPTPHIDSIAAHGVRFTAGYVTASYCSPSRAGLLSGRYQSRFGYDYNPVGEQNEHPDVGLPASEQSLPQALRDQGYATALIGKWHLGGHPQHHPLRKGFDEFFGFLHEGHFYVPPPYRGVSSILRRRTLPDGAQGRWTSPDGQLTLSTTAGRRDEPPYDANNPIMRGGQPVVESEYLTDALTREAVDFIARHREQPFFLYLSYSAVHSPMQAKSDSLEQFAHIDNMQRRIFAGMLSSLDESVGEVLKQLEQCEINDRTVVVFLSDNGGPTRELTSSNHPLRGSKGDLYEGGIRIPWVMQWPSRIAAGRVEHRPVVSLDLYATMLAAAGAPPTDGHRSDGVDLLPYLAAGNCNRPHDVLYWRMGSGTKAALRCGDWKLVCHEAHEGERNWELYDLATDMSEANNLASRHRDLTTKLTNQWQAIDSQMVAPVWSPDR
jgi:arylsulfatase B